MREREREREGAGERGKERERERERESIPNSRVHGFYAVENDLKNITCRLL
jgi:hypothetical protein